MKLLLASLVFVTLAAPARCSDPPQQYPNGWTDADAAQCLEAGGSVTRGLAGPACAMPTQDAGQACESSNDCEGLCLAEGRVCSPVTPAFGCFTTYENGATRGICAD